MNEQQTAFHHHVNINFGERKRGLGFGFWFGLFMMIVGGGLLLDAFGVLEFGDQLSMWWPSILMIIALAQIIGRSGSIVGSGILFTVGALLQLSKLDYLPGGFWGAFWPIVLILIGLSMISSRWKKKATATPVDPNFIGSVNVEGTRIDRNAIFNGVEARVTSTDFTGGDVSAIFGGVDLDLRDAQIDGGVATLTVSAIFGGVDIVINPKWKIVVKGTPIFGGIDDKSFRYQPEPNAPTLVIDATVVFGGIEIR